MQQLAKVSLVNLDTAEEFTAFTNPVALQSGVNVRYSKLDVPGLDHQVEQYSGTDNRTSALEFYCHQHATDRDIREFSRFLEALTVPSDTGNRTSSGAPPTLLVVWPKLMTREVRVLSLAFGYTSFERDLSPRIYNAAVQVSEVRRVRYFSQDLREEQGFDGQGDLDAALEFLRG